MAELTVADVEAARTPALSGSTCTVTGRFRRFEQGPDWSVLYAELPLMVLGGVAASLGLWALGRRVRARR